MKIFVTFNGYDVYLRLLHTSVLPFDNSKEDLHVKRH